LRPPADFAGGSDTSKPKTGKALPPKVQRQNLPVDKRHLLPSLPAAAAGLTTFEPVREPVVDAYASTAGARATSERNGFDEGAALYPDAGRQVTVWPEAR